MRKEIKHVIHCPKKDKHPKNKILLLLGEDHLLVHCPVHGFLKIQLRRAGVPLDFRNVSAEITEVHKKTDFELKPVPTITVGDIQEKRNGKKSYA